MAVIRPSAEPAPHAAARSALATVEIMAGVTLAHTWAGGELPSLPWLLGVAGLVFVASRQVIGCRVHLRWMLPALGAAQFVLHGFLTASAAGSGHDHMTSDAPMGLSWQMVAAHIASAAITVVVWRVRRRLLSAVLALPLAHRALPTLGHAGVTFGVWSAPRPGLWHLGAPRRGPPALACCV